MFVRTLLYGVALSVCTTFVNAGPQKNFELEEQKVPSQTRELQLSPLEAQTSGILKEILVSLDRKDIQNLKKASPVLLEKLKRFLVTGIKSSAPPEFLAKLSQMPAVERIISFLPAEALEFLGGLKESKVKALLLMGKGNLSDMGPEGAKVLAELLPATLQNLLLMNQAIGDAGAIALAAKLPQTAVKKLALENNQMGPAGAEAIAQAMSGDFDWICLDNNKIGDKGAIALAELLIPKITTATSYQGLWLPSNGITDVGANALLDALILKAKEKKITHFHLILYGNDISETIKMKYKDSGLRMNVFVGFDYILKSPLFSLSRTVGGD